MQKIDLFKQMIEQLANVPVIEDYKYIGTGNPEAKILIVGKETSIFADAEDQKTIEISNNLKDWNRIISNGISSEKIDGINYSPLYPYKGQLLKIDNRKNSGTSRTWFNYQKLYNLIYKKEDNPNIDFHEGVFITEVNSGPSLKTKDAETSSVEFRKKVLLNFEFFQSFPVVIISGVGYFEIKDQKNEIEKVFHVKFIRKERALNKESQAYWIHLGTKTPKLLINTRQLSIGVSEALLEGIANEIKNSGLIYL